MQKVYEIPGRATKAGAVTKVERVVIFEGDIKVKKTRVSRSGSHWVYEVYTKPNSRGLIVVEDLTNSGKDQSYILVIENGRPVEKIYVSVEGATSVKLGQPRLKV